MRLFIVCRQDDWNHFDHWKKEKKRERKGRSHRPLKHLSNTSYTFSNRHLRRRVKFEEGLRETLDPPS